MKEGLRVPQKTIGIAIGSAIGSLAMIACGGGNGTEPQVQNPDTPTIPPAATEPLAPTLAPAEPLTPTPEVKQEVPCQILPQEYCSQGERITMELQGEKHEYIAFNLPPGTPIFARFDGLLTKGEESGAPFSGFTALLTFDNYRSFDIMRGDLSFDDMIDRQVRQGDIIGYVGDTNVENFGYDFLYLITTAGSNGPIIDEGKMKELFPRAFEKESTEVTYTGPVEPPVSYSYDSTPPGQ